MAMLQGYERKIEHVEMKGSWDGCILHSKMLSDKINSDIARYCSVKIEVHKNSVSF